MDYVVILLILAMGLWEIQGSQIPRIIEHPIDTTVPRHEPATLNCKAEGSPPPIIQWYKDGVPLKILPGSHRIFLPAGGLFFLKVVNSRRESDAGNYWCEARNELGVSRSRNATLQVAVLRDEFRLQPQNTRVAQGDAALLECAPPRGTPEPIVIWRKNGQKLEISDSSKRVRIVDGGNLAIQDTRQTDEGQYQCVAKNVVGVRESTVALLKVHVKPFLIRGPHDQTVVESSSVTFQCRVGGDPMPDVLWRRTASGGNMPLDRVHILEDRSLRLEDVSINDEGEYSCEADNAVGSISAMGSLIVHSPPSFTIRPTAQTVEATNDASFECKSVGNPKPTMFWSIEGNRSLIFPGNKFDNFESTSNLEDLTVLTISQAKRTDNGLVIICSAINVVGSISVRSKLTVTSQEDRPPPIIIQGPVNQTLPVKSVALLNCKASGHPTPIISWYRDGIPVISSHKINITEEGLLTISDLDKDVDQGLYTCVASSRSGKSTWSGFLRLEIPTNPNIKFFRAPENAKIPSPPSKPQAVNVTDDSITLSWLPGNKIGGSEIIGYSVEIFSNNMSKGWIEMANKLQDTTYTQRDLTVGASYIFIVRSENSHGTSAPSPMSDPIVAGKPLIFDEDIALTEAQAVLSSGDVVELLEANVTDSTSVRLAWEIVNGQYVEGFYIYSRELQQNGTYRMLTVLHGGGASACTISGLEKFNEYEFFLVPFYKTVEGRPSNSRRARTSEDVPSTAPNNMEAILLNSTAVYLKWQPPLNKSINGILLNYHVIVRGFDTNNISKILTNMTVDGQSPSLLLANLSSGVMYSVSLAASTKLGIGPYSVPAILRLDPLTRKLDQGYTRYPINHNLSDDILTQTWFIVLLGSIIAVIVFLFGAMVLFKRIQFIKQTSLGSIHGNHAIGTVRKFPTLPLNSNGVWIDPAGGVWRQASAVTTTTTTTGATAAPPLTTKDQMPDYAQISAAPTLPLPDYERLTPLNMPDYAEVAGCSTFKNPTSPLYDSCGAYATTNLVKNANIFTNNFHHTNNNKKSMYSAPTSCHYNSDLLGGHSFAYSESNYPMPNTATSKSATKMNITENKMEIINNLNRAQSASSQSVPIIQQLNQNGFGGYGSSSSTVAANSANSNGSTIGSSYGHCGTMKRNRLPKIGHCDKIKFGGGSDSNRTLEQPLFVKSKEDGSWTTVHQNKTYHFQSTPTINFGGGSNLINNSDNISKINFNSGNNMYGNNAVSAAAAAAATNGNNNSASQIYLSSFGKTENV